MEGSHDERIRVVYYCGTIEEDLCELYHDESPPKRAEDSAHRSDTLEALHANIASLLDDDEGGFHEGMFPGEIATAFHMLTPCSLC